MTDKQQLESDLKVSRNQLWYWFERLAEAQDLPQHAIYTEIECKKMIVALEREIKDLRLKQGKQF